MAISVTQVHGMYGDVVVGSTHIPITEWNGEDTADTKDGTTTANAGWKSRVAGLREMTGSFKCVWDTAQNPYLISIAPNTVVALKLYVVSQNYIATAAENSFYSMNAMLKSISVSEPVGDLVTYTVNFESQGVVTPPA